MGDVLEIEFEGLDGKLKGTTLVFAGEGLELHAGLFHRVGGREQSLGPQPVVVVDRAQVAVAGIRKEGRDPRRPSGWHRHRQRDWPPSRRP